MSLSRHVDPEEIVQRLGDLHIPQELTKIRSQIASSSNLTPYSTRYASSSGIPKFKMPEEGAPGDAVYSMLKDELDLDGRPSLNLASFVSTFMDDKAEKLLIGNLSKNLADNDEYPAMLSISQRCISILAHLWGVQKGEKAIGSPTTGSSEAIHLGGLAMKRRWKERRTAEGKDTFKPNIIMGANAQVALEKFARYFEVEARILPVSAKSQYRLDPDLVRENIDENTIGVFVILGSTYTGHYEPVDEISQILDEYQEKTGIDIPIHVDAASGGFVAPFTHAQAGGHKWNFELPRVKSINASGHKYGLVYPGVGWIVWRDESYLPKHLIFELHYLGGTEESYTLNFSRPGAHVLAQYYNLVHLGFAGYREIMENCLRNARLLSRSLEATGWYTCVSDIHRLVGQLPGASVAEGIKAKVLNAIGEDSSKPRDEGGDVSGKGASKMETSADYMPGLPVVAFRFSDEFRKMYPHIQQSKVSTLLRARQWIIPNYGLPPNESSSEILRVVIRENMSFDLLDRLITDIVDVTQMLIDDDQIDLDILHSRGRSTGKQKKTQAHAESKEEPKAQETTEFDKLGKEFHKVAQKVYRGTC